MPRFVVVLVETEFEGTIGLVARAMKNFNLQELRLVNPAASIGRTAGMRASHAQEVIDRARTFKSLDEALADVDISAGTTAQRARSVHRILRKPVTPHELADSLRTVDGTVALVFGPEGTGLSNHQLDQCDIALTIPASPAYPTLNASHAAAILFHELYNSKSKTPREILAGADVKRTILTFVENASEAVGLPTKDRILVLRAFRNVMGRSSLRAREASLLAGFLRETSTHLGNPPEASGNELSER